MNRRARRLLNDLDQEIREHLELATQENIERGMSPEEARRAALRKFGNVTQAKGDAREVWTVVWAEQLLQDIRFAFRQLRKSRGFAFVAILTLALGIGANTAVFSVADAVLLKPLRFADPASLAIVWEKLPAYSIARNTVSPPNFLDWQQQNRSFNGLAAFLDQPVNLTGAGRPEQIDVEQVSANFFSVLGVEPTLGRGFVDGEDQPGNANVAVLSYALWKSKFAGDPDIVGRTIQLNGQGTTVVGVTGPDFDWYISEFSSTNQQPKLWTPLEAQLA